MKLQSLLVSPTAISWFTSYLTQRSQVTKVGTAVSESLPVTVGVHPRPAFVYHIYIRFASVSEAL